MARSLEDTLETLIEKKAEVERTIEELTNKLSNNKGFSLNSSISSEDLTKLQKQLHYNLLQDVQKVEPENYPIPKTTDIHIEVVTEIKKEIFDMKELLSNLEKKLYDIQEDIEYLRNKKSGFEKMQEAYLGYTEMFANRTYENEYFLTKRIFREAKNDLYTLINIIFPNNQRFKDLLAALTTAHMRGGDNVYIDVISDDLNYINFLLEADIIQYHPNDRTKIKMIELL